MQDESKLPAAKPEQMPQQSNVNLPSLGRAQRIDLLDEAIQSPASDAKTIGRNDDSVTGQIVAGESPTPQSAGMNHRAEAQTTLNKDNSQKQLVQQQRAVFLLRIVQPTDRAASEPPFPAARGHATFCDPSRRPQNRLNNSDVHLHFDGHLFCET